MLLSLGFLFYKFPVMMNYFFIEIPQYSIPFFSLATIFFTLSGYYFDNKTNNLNKKEKKLKENLKDAK
jgi:hypothetical protein